MQPSPETFAAAARRDGFALDPHQRAAAAVLSRLDPRDGRGIYLWGGVGRGKTWMIDTLRAALPQVRSTRLHFHDFFRRLHALTRAEGVGGALDRMVGECEVLFFDEFHVHDVGDAALLTRLLDTLDAHRVSLVVTSNYPPSELLPNPLFHDGFVPTIERLHRRLDVVPLGGDRDYRVESSTRDAGFASGSYLDADERPAQGEGLDLVVGGRSLRALAVRDGLVWFDFTDLCEAPTAASDYLTLAATHHRWVVSGVPEIGAATEFGVQRFCTLIDVLHDADLPLTVVGADWRRGQSTAHPDLARARSRLSLLR